jgi:Tfp pilus assembly PilM family ATPase
MKRFFERLFWGTTHVAVIAWSDDAVRGLVLRRKRGEITIEETYEHELPHGCIHGGMIADRPQFVVALQRAKRAVGARAHILIPDDHIAVFHSTLPRPYGHIDPVVIEDHLRAFLLTHDIAQDSVTCEYEIVSTTDEEIDLHVTVVPNKVFRDARSALHSAGVHVLSIEAGIHRVSSHCLLPSGQGVILVDIGERRSLVALSHEGRIVAREHITGGIADVRNAITRFLGATNEEANRIIEGYGVLQAHPDNGLLSELLLALSPIPRAIDSIIRQTISTPYRKSHLRFKPEHIVLYGSGANIKGIDLYLGVRTHLPVRFLTFEHPALSATPDRIPKLPAHKVLPFAPLLARALSEE